MSDTTIGLPPFLSIESEMSDGQRTYGTLSYNAKQKCWIVKAEPMVTSLCKRLFPGCETSKRGIARFTAHKRILADLHWLMLRYPLEVRKQDNLRWKSALAEVRKYTLKKDEQKNAPLRIVPNKSTFTGKLTTFQEEGLAFLLSSDRALLADEMGLGKTVQALAMIVERSKYPVLIVTPSHLLCNWQKEILKFTQKEPGVPLTIHVIKGLTEYDLPEADIYLIHYLVLRGWKTTLPKKYFHTVIFDEIQELRHSGTEKYSVASLLSESAEHVFGLSGTPIYNKGAEIWNIINILDFHFLGNYESFSREWCYGYGNQIVAKPDLLGEHLREEGMLFRRLKRDVLQDLPPKRRAIIAVETDTKTYNAHMNPILPLLEKLIHEEFANESEKALLRIEIANAERRATGIAKTPYVVQFVKALLESEERVLLFAHHHAVMDQYKKLFKAYSPAFITGRETSVQKEKAVERFMGGKTNLCCISLRACAGLNLQRASCVVFGELDWSPAVHSQAEDRAHRMGQKDSVLSYYLVSEKGSDAEMQDALGLKVSQFVQLMGDEMQSVQEQLFNERDAKEYATKQIQRLIQSTSKTKLKY